MRCIFCNEKMFKDSFLVIAVGQQGVTGFACTCSYNYRTRYLNGNLITEEAKYEFGKFLVIKNYSPYKLSITEYMSDFTYTMVYSGRKQFTFNKKINLDPFLKFNILK